MSATVTQLEPRINIAELSQLLGVSRRWIEYRIEEGLPSAKIGGRRLFKPSEVENWLQKEGK